MTTEEKINLLNSYDEIADENNNKLIRNALIKLLTVEDTIAVQERAKRFLSEL